MHARCPWHGLAVLRLVAMLAALAACVGCGGYAVRMEEVRTSLQSDDYGRALTAIDDLIVTAESGQKPEANDLPLLLLERASLLQAMHDHVAATADLMHADGMLEALDLTPDRIGNAAEYLWSGSASLYRPPLYEKLMVNVSALSSYLAVGDLSSARVEARRIGVLVDYFATTDVAGHPMIGAANFMAGLAMELGGESGEALRFYLAAWAVGDAPGLPEAIARLAENSPLAGNPEVQRAREAIGLGPGDPAPVGNDSEVVAIVLHGRAPYRLPEYIPIGLVVTWFRANSAYALSGDQEAAMARGIAEDLLTWINFPTLVVADNRIAKIDVYADGVAFDAARIANIEAFALEQWERDRPGIAFAAIIRALVRVAAREAVQAVGNAAGGAGQTIGFLAGLATQGAMQAADTPDTRVWTLMPAYVSIARFAAAPGAHTVVIEGAGSNYSERVELPVVVPQGGAGIVTARLLR